MTLKQWQKEMKEAMGLTAWYKARLLMAMRKIK